MNLIQVVLVDDHPGVRLRIRQLLQSEEDIKIIGEAGDGLEALRLIEAQQPDVVLLDLEMPGINGIEVARRLRAANFPTRILALSSHDDPHYIQGMLDTGAAGYVTKAEAPQVLVQAVRSVAHGDKPWISQRAAAQIAALSPVILTALEIEILRAVDHGETDSEIETRLGLAEEAVNAQFKTIFTKLNVTSREEAVRRARQNKLI